MDFFDLINSRCGIAVSGVTLMPFYNVVVHDDRNGENFIYESTYSWAEAIDAFQKCATDALTSYEGKDAIYECGDNEYDAMILQRSLRIPYPNGQYRITIDTIFGKRREDYKIR